MCINFWFHMYGSTIGTLTVYLVTGATNTTLWSLSGDHGDQWFNGQTGYSSVTPFTVSFDSIVSSPS
ncbi:hypothetical protein DPMN_011713 [Dreissena polymorpha]|uniref:MAM domain-containing protein n=1 Tax=Dreissena polymorpha TaxID=45954 RepID=A0A9D4N4M2_DREPO|nr:hypothetical protein DPMN_011713 [Dreissena polymorpha]